MVSHPSHTSSVWPQKTKIWRSFFSISLACLLASSALHASVPINVEAEILRQADNNLRLQLSEQGFSQTEAIQFEHTNAYRSQHNGLNHIYYRQMLNGLPIVNALANTNISDGGQNFGQHVQFFPGLEQQLSLIHI